jgi:hypothetical protein
MQRPVRDLRAYPSFDQRDVWEANHASYSYDYSTPVPQTQAIYQEGEYYSQENDHEQSYIAPEQARNHARGNSTEDMLVLDRYTGGHGQGLSGKGGGRWGSEWGVDLSDVPVFLQRVRVES